MEEAGMNINAGRKKKKLIVFLIILLLLAGAYYWFAHGRYAWKQHKEDKKAWEAGLIPAQKAGETLSEDEMEELRNNFPGIVMSKEEFFGKDYEEKLKSQKSDIKGMTQWDKYQMGLSVEDGSDSDADGLTDKKEIEKYGTDPLKKSTAGDLYTDGEKVESGKDPLKYCEYEGEIKFRYNKLDMFRFSAVDGIPRSLDAYAKKENNNWYMMDQEFAAVFQGYDVLAEYTVYNTYGTLSLDVGKIAEKNGMDADDVVLIISTCLSQGWNKVDYTCDGTVLTPDLEFDGNARYIAVCRKHSTMDGVLDTLNLKSDDGKNVSGSRAGDGLITYTKVSEFFGGQPSIYYVKTGNKKTDERAVSILVEAANFASETDTMDDGRSRPNILTDPVSDKDVEYISQTEMDMKVYFYKTFTPAKCRANPYELWESIDNVPEEMMKVTSWCMWCPSELINGYNRGYSEENEEAEKKTAKTEFSLKEDTLPFPNFSSPYTEGNCSGFARLTRLLYNNRTFLESGHYVIDGGRVDWDLSDEENRTLTDPGLGDYKDYSFSEHLEESNCSGLPAPERNFVDMLGCMWREENDIPRIISTDDNRYTIGMVEEAARRLDKGEILSLSMETGGMYNMASSQTAPSPVGYHEVNVYGYRRQGSMYFFYIYDNNLPRDRIKIGTTTYNVKRNEIRIWPNEDGTIEWDWFPQYVTPFSVYQNPGYGAWSITGHRLCFIAGDKEVICTRESDPEE